MIIRGLIANFEIIFVNIETPSRHRHVFHHATCLSHHITNLSPVTLVISPLSHY